MPEKLSIDDAKELLNTLVTHAAVENKQRADNGLELKRFFICPACEEVSETSEDCRCTNWRPEYDDEWRRRRLAAMKRDE